MTAVCTQSESFSFTFISSGIKWFLNCILIALILSLSIPSVYSQDGERLSQPKKRYQFRQVTVEDGLSQNMISHIYQDHKGFIWIGTKDGLNMYDGHQFKVFKYDPFDSLSLSDNYITSVYEDPSNRLWIGTLNGGVHCFDRKTEKFTNFSHDPDDANSISRNQINAITGDRSGNIWIGTNGSGINKLICQDGEISPRKNNVRIERYDGLNDSFPEQYARISALFVDSHDQMWIGTTRNIYKYNTSGSEALFGKVIFQQANEDSLMAETISDYTTEKARVFLEDHNGGIWMGNGNGLFNFDNEQQQFTQYIPEGNLEPIPSVATATLFANGAKEEIWIGSEEKIYILNPTSGKYNLLSNERDQNIGLQRGWFTYLFSDMGGVMWVGSNGHGLSLFNPGSTKFNYPNDSIEGSRLSESSVRTLGIHSFLQSSQDDNSLWIGSNDGLFRIDRSQSVMTPVNFYGNTGSEKEAVFHLCEDEGYIWIGSTVGLVRFNPENGRSRIFPTGLSDSIGGVEPRVSYVYISNGKKWILTPNTIARLDQDQNSFQHFRYNDEPLNQFSEAVYPSILEDIKGNFWIAAKNGLHYFDVKSLKITNYLGDSNLYKMLERSETTTIMADPSEPEKYLWVGTGTSGFYRLEIESGNIVSYSEKDGLVSNDVFGMLADNGGNIWISTNHGLSKFNIANQSFSNYNTADGLQSNIFNRGAYFKSSLGEMFFGGIEGYNCFYPSDIVPKYFMPPVVFTDLRLYNEFHETVTDLNFNVRETNRVNLAYNQNHFTVDFASMDFASPANNMYAYSMPSSGEGWINTGNQRSVTFTELKPGDYMLRVRGTNSDGVWSDKEAVLYITIGRPWWSSNWSYFFYLTLILGALYAVRKYELSRVRLKNQMRLVNVEAEKFKEMDHLKSQFFANISHEFRTPLTLIKGPLEQLMESSADLKNRNTYSSMHSNTTHLLSLVNQLLDLSKIDSGNYSLKANRGDIVGFTEGLTMSYASLAKQKKINLSIIKRPGVEEEEFRENFYYDSEILEKIIISLLSNAFKFTPEKGKVKVKLDLLKEDENVKFLEIVIEDTGKGIPEDKLPYIFDRYYQADLSKKVEFENDRIGLAYVNELVKVHMGEIRVTSVDGTGTVFILRLPVGKSHFLPNQIVPDKPVAEYQEKDKHPLPDHVIPASSGNVSESNGKPWVLVVEDHIQVRKYIQEVIQHEYRVMEASNALEGYSMAEEFIPDLIISDIMMPEMDGFEYCKKIKSNEKTSHIPIILVTAKAEFDDKLCGLEIGADDYITKPFNAKELQIRIKNLIDNRAVLRKKFRSNSIIRPGEISVTSIDTSFMERLMALVEENMGNCDFTVEELGKEAGMSQSQLHRKLKAVVNMSANQFIISVRMHRALELLHNGTGNISEIAYMVGYDDPGYFTKSFRKFFDKLPSEISKK